MKIDLDLDDVFKIYYLIKMELLRMREDGVQSYEGWIKEKELHDMIGRSATKKEVSFHRRLLATFKKVIDLEVPDEVTGETSE